MQIAKLQVHNISIYIKLVSFIHTGLKTNDWNKSKTLPTAGGMQYFSLQVNNIRNFSLITCNYQYF